MVTRKAQALEMMDECCFEVVFQHDGVEVAVTMLTVPVKPPADSARAEV